MCFCLGIWGALEIITSANKKSFSIESERTLAKLGVLLKIYLFAWDIDVFWILLERKNSEHLCKIKYSGKDTPIYLKYWRVLCGICWLPGKTMAFFFILDELTEGHLQWTGKSRCSVEQLNILERTPVLNLILATEHLNSWQNEPVLISDKLYYEKEQSPVRKREAATQWCS